MNNHARSQATQSDWLDRYSSLWELSDDVPDLKDYVLDNPPPSISEFVEAVLIDQAHRWKTSQAPAVEEYLVLFPDISNFPELLIEMIYGEYRARSSENNSKLTTEMLNRFPTLRKQLLSQFEFHQWLTDQNKQAFGVEYNPTEISFAPLSNTGTDDLRAPDVIALESAAPLTLSDFHLEKQLGIGGMGEVYRARQLSLNREVAIKFLKQWMPSDPQLMNVFFTEARSIASLKNPNIVQVHGVGRTEDGTYFIVMELVEGNDLQSRIVDGPLPISEVIWIGIEVAKALDHAHSRGIVHRDLKPGNVMLDTNGRVVVMDFGLAQRLDKLGDNTPDSGKVIGTPQFMAPEQAHSHWGRVGPHSDIYGLGGLLYALLTGKPPLQGNSQFELLSRLASSEEPIPVRKLRPEVPASLDAICAKCLHKNPALRYLSAREVEDALRVLADFPLKVHEYYTSPPTVRVDCSESDSSPAFCHRSNIKRQLRMDMVGMLLLILFVALIWHLRSPATTDTHQVSSAPTFTDYGTDSANATFVTIEWIVDVFRSNQRSERYRITESTDHIQTGDSLRVELHFSRPVYPSVYWIGSDGTIASLYESIGPLAQRLTSVSIPDKMNQGIPIIGPTGTEVCMVVFRNHPGSESDRLLNYLTENVPFMPLPEHIILFRGGQFDLQESQNQVAPDLDATSNIHLDWHKMTRDSRNVGAAVPLIEDAAIVAFRERFFSLPVDFGYVECLVLRHLPPP